MQHVVVTGASGWLGSRICAALERDGETVRRVVRQQGVAGEFGWDFGRSDALGPLVAFLRGSDTIIHCAARVHVGNDGDAAAKAHHAVNAAGTRQLVQAAREAGVQRFVFLSTIAVYHWDGLCRPATEDLIESGESAYAKSKRAAEQFVAESGLDWRIARLATVFGEGTSPISCGWRGPSVVVAFVPGDGDSRKSVVSIDRAVEIIRGLAAIPAPRHRLLNVGSPTRPTLREISDAFSDLCGFARVPSLGPVASRWLARLGDGLRTVGLPAPYDSATLTKLNTDTMVAVQRQQELFPDLQWGNFHDDLRRHRDYYLAST